MTSIWAFLLQTISVSLVAALLFLLKTIFADKLSPRWQYGIWSLLALRILLPVGTERGILLPQLPLWIEVLKSRIEFGRASAYAAVFDPLSCRHILPEFSGAPRSITDWLLVVYAAGIVVFAARYAIAYLRLRRLLRKNGRAVPAEFLDAVCIQYHLKPCFVVEVEGLPSAFVCGVFRPVLAIPAGEAVDEKILLHELLHLKHYDAAQSVFWCALRCLHWCNPVLHIVFDIIGNDMESLCDQRVLERLEGEERREYGIILLSMASERYARCPGTTSISNGGTFIARRIEAIVRFKKYPKGMAVVALCIAAALVSPTLQGSAVSFAGDDYVPSEIGELNRAMAAARLNRCSTVAGAIDTYARGLIQENGVFIAMASPLEAHEAIAAQMYRAATEENWVSRHLDSGVELDYVSNDGYQVFDLTEQRDGSYTGYLAFVIHALVDEYGHGWGMGNRSSSETGHVILPVRVYQSDGWVVEETDRRIFTTQVAYGGLTDPGEGFPTRVLTAEGEYGTATISFRTEYVLSTDITSIYPEPRAVFDEAATRYFTEYAPHALPEESYTVQVIPLPEGKDPRFWEEPYPNAYGYDADGSFTMKKRADSISGSFGHHLAEYRERPADRLMPEGWQKAFAQPPAAPVFHVGVWWNDKPVETFALKEEVS